MNLTAENINAVLFACFFTDEEVANGPPTNFVPAHGVRHSVGFHPERLESHREDVKSMLSQLPSDFMHDQGGGQSLLNMVVDKDGHQYGEQHHADALFMLGQALGYATTPMPRETWWLLPGGLPYITVKI